MFVTGNIHKFAEARRILKPCKIRLGHLKQSYPEIRSDEVEEIALEAARSLFKKIKKPLIVEDSGIFIPSLNNFPGAYSAWVFKKMGNRGILKLLENSKDRSAYFKSCIAFSNGKTEKIFCGEVRGTISKRETGDKGFGYDPIFVPENETQTFAESEMLKNRLSHRSNAFTAFAKWYSNYSKPEK